MVAKGQQTGMWFKNIWLMTISKNSLTKEAVSVQAKVMGAWTRVETGHILSGFSGHIPQGYCTLLPWHSHNPSTRLSWSLHLPSDTPLLQICRSSEKWFWWADCANQHNPVDLSITSVSTLINKNLSAHVGPLPTNPASDSSVSPSSALWSVSTEAQCLTQTRGPGCGACLNLPGLLSTGLGPRESQGSRVNQPAVIGSIISNDSKSERRVCEFPFL